MSKENPTFVDKKKELYMKKEHHITICPDIDCVLMDEEGCGDSCYEDEIYNTEAHLAPIFSFVVPGFYEWHRRFEDKTDFAETTTDPSFDWRSWHRDGLLFAKEIYRQLPRNYNLIYRSPYEDRSGVIAEVDLSKDNIDSIIKSLGASPYNPDDKPSYKDNIIVRIWDEIPPKVFLSITLSINKYSISLAFHNYDDLKRLRLWMEHIAEDREDIIQTQFSPGYKFIMIPQRIGQFTQMGRFRIEALDPDDCFSGYVNRREFVRTLYLSLMTHFGFGAYKPNEFQKSLFPEQDIQWVLYNTLRSDIIEWFITDELYQSFPIPKNSPERKVNETVVMFPDGGCCFWDTMGAGCGDEEGLHLDSGDFDMDIPGLRKWIAGEGGSWWENGWELAKEVRKRLPSNIDLYYMCFDPSKPEDKVAYHCSLPRLLVPYSPYNNYKELIRLHLSQGEHRVIVGVSRKMMDKMNEIASRSPEGAWAKRGFELFEAAAREMKE